LEHVCLMTIAEASMYTWMAEREMVLSAVESKGRLELFGIHPSTCNSYYGQDKMRDRDFSHFTQRQAMYSYSQISRQIIDIILLLLVPSF